MTFEQDFEIIKNLTETQACSGNEGSIRDYIKKTVEPYCDQIETDILGNLFCIISGKSGDSKLKVLLDAHMDEIGFMVRFINKTCS